MWRSSLTATPLWLGYVWRASAGADSAIWSGALWVSRLGVTPDFLITNLGEHIVTDQGERITI